MPTRPAPLLQVLVPALLLTVQTPGIAVQAPSRSETPRQTAPAINPDLLARRWEARWIVPPGADPFAGGSPRGSQDAPNRWLLVPRTIPLMEERPERFAAVRQSAGVSVPAAFPKARATITMGYAEALYTPATATSRPAFVVKNRLLKRHRHSEALFGRQDVIGIQRRLVDI